MAAGAEKFTILVATTWTLPSSLALIGMSYSPNTVLSPTPPAPRTLPCRGVMVLGVPTVQTLRLVFPCCPATGTGAAGISTTVALDGLPGLCARCRPSLAHACSSCRGAFCLGLLARIGELALATLYPLEYARCCSRLWNIAISLSVLEQRAFAMDHRELCSAMLADWGLPRVFHQPAFLPSSQMKVGLCRGLTRFRDCPFLHLSSFIAEIFVAEEAERPIFSESVVRDCLPACRSTPLP